MQFIKSWREKYRLYQPKKIKSYTFLVGKLALPAHERMQKKPKTFSKRIFRWKTKVVFDPNPTGLSPASAWKPWQRTRSPFLLTNGPTVARLTRSYARGWRVGTLILPKSPRKYGNRTLSSKSILLRRFVQLLTVRKRRGEHTSVTKVSFFSWAYVLCPYLIPFTLNFYCRFYSSFLV